MTDTIPQQVAARAAASHEADLQQALANMRKFQHSMAPPDLVLVIDMRMKALDEIYARTDWNELHAEANRVFVDSRAALERARVETVRIEEEKVGHPITSGSPIQHQGTDPNAGALERFMENDRQRMRAAMKGTGA